MKKGSLSVLCLFFLLCLYPFFWKKTGFDSEKKISSPIYETETMWVDSVIKTMSLREKIGQLFVVACNPKTEGSIERVIQHVKEHHIGGIIMFKTSPSKALDIHNNLQKQSKIPLFVGIDGEWGLSMRLDSCIEYPKNMALGAIENDTLIEEMGKHIAMQSKRLGININFAPVIDVNVNPKNPVINFRSFGENKMRVADKGIAYMKGMQNQHVLACAKHFPGHGDTEQDSHFALPLVSHNKDRLEDIEFYPFKALIKNGVGSVMIAHLSVPALGTVGNEATTLTKHVVTDILKNELHFKGLIITDALNMKGVSRYYKPGEVDAKALLAGNDILLYSLDVSTAIKYIEKAISKGNISVEDINQKCRKILRTKYWLGLHKNTPIKEDNLHKDLHKKTYYSLKRKLIKESLTIIKNASNTLPVVNSDSTKYASLSIGVHSVNNAFQDRLLSYADVENFSLKYKHTKEEGLKIIQALQQYDVVIVSLHKTSNYFSRKYGITENSITLIDSLLQTKHIIFNYLGNPYGLDYFRYLYKADAIIVGYEDNDDTRDISAQLIFGGIPSRGTLPVTINHRFQSGLGLYTNKIRIEYGIPEEVGLHTDSLKKINELVKNAIDNKAIPGCQIVVLKDGMVVYNKPFGYHTYAEKLPTKSNDLYDVASITKIASSTLSVMKLVDLGIIHLDDPLGKMLPDMMIGTDYQDLTLREILAHNAGLVPWIPFYKKTIQEPMKEELYCDCNHEYNIQLSDELCLKESFEDSIFNIILNTPLRKKGYKYSDLGYYFIQEIIEKYSGTSIDTFVSNTFYKQMHLRKIGYLPLDRFKRNNVVPSEVDLYFRNNTIVGYTHDPGAALLGGVAGHAGLFSNAEDLAVLMQLFLDSGRYGGISFLSPNIINEFTKQQFPQFNNRRGAGFDRPTTVNNSPCSNMASKQSFGHTGFTGTIVWTDKTYNLTYVFLSNRTFPDGSNMKLVRMNVRTDIHSLIYRSMI